jgi:uncharacterized membrane protein YphA (DoxX/SURF4 family)
VKTTILRLAQQLGRLAGLTPVVVRVIVGFMMFAHGVDKLSGGVAGIAGFGEFLSSAGLPTGLLLAWFVTLLELIGGVMLILGLLSRVIAGLLIVELLVAIALVTGQAGLISGDQGVDRCGRYRNHHSPASSAERVAVNGARPNKPGLTFYLQK